MFSVTPCICGHPPTRAVAPSSYIVCMSRGGRGATSWYFRRGSKIFVTCCTKQTCFWKFRGGSNCPAPCCEPVHVYLHFVYRLYFVRAKFESKFFPPVWRNLGLIYARLVTSLGWGDVFFMTQTRSGWWNMWLWRSSVKVWRIISEHIGLRNTRGVSKLLLSVVFTSRF